MSMKPRKISLQRRFNWASSPMTSLNEDDDDKSISSESSGGDMQGVSPNYPPQNYREDLEIWNAKEIDMSLRTLPNADKAQEMLDMNLIDGNVDSTILNIALLLACRKSDATAVTQLLQTYNVDVDFKDLKGRTPLHFSCLNGDQLCVKLLLRHNAKAHIWDSNEKATPLHCAASVGNADCIQLLLKNGAQINSGIEKKSALHFAVQRNAFSCVKILLQYGANPNTPQVFTETPLHVAAGSGYAECMQLLLDSGADVRSKYGYRKNTALHIAAEDDFYECVKILLDKGANINAVNGDGQTPLHLACLSQSVESVNVLIERGANVNAIYKDGRTALHAAIVKQSRFWDCGRLLLDAKVDVNRADNFGYTPLHIAALNEFSSCVMMLLDYGADVTARTNGGITALSFIVRRTPEVLPKFLTKFDSSIEVNEHEIGDVDCKIKLDFRTLVPNFERGETEFLLTFIEVGQRNILSHPLCETFLFLKWRRIRKFFLFSLFYHFIFVLIFTVYILAVYVKDCDIKDKIEDKNNECQAPTYVVPIGYAVLLLNFTLLLKESFQMAHGFYGYLRYWENWLQCLVFLGVFLCSRPNKLKLHEHDISKIPMWQHHVAAIVIFLVWLELMMIVGRFPTFGLYIQMFTTVAVNFSKFLMAYCCLLIAFALSFAVLFPNYPAFESAPWALLKTVIMMSGELEFEDIFYGDGNSNETQSKNGTQVKYPYTSQLVFFTFVLLVTVILTNLMVGLAVSDIQGLQLSAGLDRLSRQAELVARLESFLFSKLFRKAPTKIIRWCQQNALLRTSRYCLQIIIKPNDPREKRIPRDLINSIYKLVAERRDRNLSIRRRKRRNNLNLFCDFEESLKNVSNDIELRTHRNIRPLTISEAPRGTLRSSDLEFFRPHASSLSSTDIQTGIRKHLKLISDSQDSILIKLNSMCKDINVLKMQKK